MLLPTYLLPDNLGLKWGISKEECLAQLGTPLIRATSNYLVVKLCLLNEPYEIGLQFKTSQGLWRIEANLYISRDFWENYTNDEMDAIISEYQNYYNNLKDYCILELGPPDFSGRWGTDGYPEDQTANHITYWNNPQGRMQIEYEHPDKEYPIIVRVACYTP